MYITLSLSKDFGVWVQHRDGVFGVSLGFVALYVCCDRTIVFVDDVELRKLSFKRRFKRRD